MGDDRLDQLDYYTLLRVEPGASADAIRSAYHEFALRYHPDRFCDAPEAKRERAAQIFRRGAEGYRVLMDPQSRRRYDEGLAQGKLRLVAEEERDTRRPPTPSGRFEVVSPKARPFASKALQAYSEGDYKTAKLNLKLALGYEPDNPVLKARLADVEQRLASR
jgi:curved DNA-binding protein CbpA